MALELGQPDSNVLQFPSVEQKLDGETASTINDVKHHAGMAVKAPKTGAFQGPYGISYKNITPDDTLNGILFNGECEFVASVEEIANACETRIKKRYLKQAKKLWIKHLKHLKKGKLPDDTVKYLENFTPHMLFNFGEIGEEHREEYQTLYDVGHAKQEAWRDDSQKEAV